MQRRTIITILAMKIFLLVAFPLSVCCAFVHQSFPGRAPLTPFLTVTGRPVDVSSSFLLALTDSESNDSDDDLPVVAKSTVKIDDGGSDLTDRFKYKVNALMGNFDPQAGDDTEEDTGNIISALTNFPAKFAFTVVGKTNGAEELKEKYIEDVRSIILKNASGSVDTLELRATPRGGKFTRVSVEVEVESTAMINSIYSELSDIENTIMKF